MTINELRALALAATPGEWANDEQWPRWVLANDEPLASTVHSSRPEADAAYIAALSPERVLAMIAVIEAAKAMHVEYDQDLYTTATNKAFKAALAKLERERYPRPQCP